MILQKQIVIVAKQPIRKPIKTIQTENILLLRRWRLHPTTLTMDLNEKLPSRHQQPI